MTATEQSARDTLAANGVTIIREDVWAEVIRDYDVDEFNSPALLVGSYLRRLREHILDDLGATGRPAPPSDVAGGFTDGDDVA